MRVVDGKNRSRYGGAVSEKELLWAQLYDHVFDRIGVPNGLVVPMGDMHHEGVSRVSTVCFGGSVAVFDYLEAIQDYDIPPYYKGPAEIPIISFNGIDEMAESPDASFWTRDDAGGANGFSVGVWAGFTELPSSSQALFGKYRDGGEQEWMLFVNGSSDRVRFTINDKVAGANCYRQENALAPIGVLTFWVATYDGRGGGSAGDGIRIYRNGVLSTSSASNDASYVGMRNSTSTVNIARNAGASRRQFSGEMAGGPLGPFWTRDVVTADDVKRLYHLGRAALGS